MEPLRKITSKTVPLPSENVDTDQIIPARFLKTTERRGLGRVVFNDWRYDGNGDPKPDFVLNRPEYAGRSILIAGNNFGCGSSREHAPWALCDFGFKAVVSTSFADIFRNNALKNGLLPIVVDRETHTKLLQLAADQPDAVCSIDLESQSLSLPDGSSHEFPIDAFSRRCLLDGVDELGYLLNMSGRIAEFEAGR
jgi:3-isopropylmalate/(R)-2-methylmalate dehydratase small subunit